MAVRVRFTLFDLLVTITLIAVLMAAITPWLNTVRESSRRSTCTANQKQIALAAKMYEERFKQHSPSAFRVNDGGADTYIDGSDTVISDLVPASPGSSGTAAPYSMFVKLLPYLDQEKIYEQLDFTLDAFDARSKKNTRFADTIIPELICPSFRGWTIITTAPYDTVNVAITNYKF
ncbi:MAG: DUF1559 domain-containing protein, partial [Planctomycetales bacterium]